MTEHQKINAKKEQYYKQAASVYPMIDTLSMSNMDALDHIIVLNALREQYAADKMHTWAMTHNESYVRLFALMRRAAITKIESMWPRLARRGHRWPAQWVVK